ncbi:hypothetical protein [Desulfovibrio inopinatus]|uniref:hypothetical protein n=1 Tax=Desulfovibrio inopinatus TaxID=102109 RepID=UPI0004081E24|nr:hypothetical protein [Desulfovibrio inopinatus]
MTRRHALAALFLCCCMMLPLRSAHAQNDSLPELSISQLKKIFGGLGGKKPGKLDFTIIGGYANFVRQYDEASGRYYIENQYLTRLTGYIYQLDLDFMKRLKVDLLDFAPDYTFREKKRIYFWYANGDRIIFKIGPSKQTIKIGQKQEREVKISSMETYSMEVKRLTQDFELRDGKDEIVIQVKFK